MTVPNIRSVGFCAHYSKQGDWAFAYALGLSRRYGLKLNVFHFLCDPYSPVDDFRTFLAPSELNRVVIEKERELRLYYDRLAGDYLDVGFRLCHDDGWHELHRCLLIHEFQLLVLAYPEQDARFIGKPIEEFADGFVCPVVLVGPERPDWCHLNSGAALLCDKLGLDGMAWKKIEHLVEGPASR